MRLSLIVSMFLLTATSVAAQTAQCTESAIKEGKVPVSDETFAFMPRYGKPVTGKPAMQAAEKEAFPGRTNFARTWQADHRIVVAPSGEMAYESGTLRVAYDEGGKRTEFDAAMLLVYQVKNGTCQRVALTMNPLTPSGKQ